MNRRDLTLLHAMASYPSISVFVPMHRTMPDRQQDPIRFKNLVRKAMDRLLEEFSKRDVAPLLAQLDDVVTRIDYTKALDGLVLFANHDIVVYYHVPFPVEERLHIDKNFDIKPLLYGLNRSPRYWVLTLSRNACRLFSGIGDQLTEIIEPTADNYGNPVSGFPLNDLGPEEHQRLAIASGDKDAQYFDNRRKEFFRFIDKSLARFIEADPLPLILLGDEQDLSAFDQVSHHKKYIIVKHAGNHDRDTAYTLAHQVWPHVQAYLDKEREQLVASIPDAIGRLHFAFDIHPVWRMAHEGRIQILFVEDNFHIAGRINLDNPQQFVIEEHTGIGPESIDNIVDELIELVFIKRGHVVFVQSGTLAPYKHIAAILRY